jgi:hypothetical protein
MLIHGTSAATSKRASGAQVARGLLLLLASSTACGSQELLVCGEIPTDGCPLGRGGTCDDVLCAALYDCVEGDWTLIETCEQHGDGGAAGGTASGNGGAGGCSVPIIDHTGETSGCEPDLLDPDCPVQAAEVCGDPCGTGCIDFFLCLERGWTSVAFCTEDGELVLEEARTR